MPEEIDQLFKRTWAAIDEIGICVNEQSVEEDEDQAYHTRVHAVAMTMVGLGLGVESIGALAICVSELEAIMAEDSPSESDDVEWPENID